MNELNLGVPALTPSAPRWIISTHALLPNGPAHRLLDALREKGREVGLCAVPLPGGTRTRGEWVIPGSIEHELFIDRQQPVPIWREPISAFDMGRFARRLRSTRRDPVVVVGCDPVAYFEMIAALAVSGIEVLSDAVWFVDWSAQRLDGRLSGAAYKSIARCAARHADVVGAISPPAARAIAELGRSRREEEILTLPNMPLAFLDTEILTWDARPRGVVYLGGLSPGQGVELLLQASSKLTNAGCTLDVAGDGPSADAVASAAKRIPGLTFHGVIHDRQELSTLMNRARVGLALYDPAFPMNSFNDPLKVKDYLNAGLRVVTTSPRAVDDGAVLRATYDVDGIVGATLSSLSRPAEDPRQHTLLNEAQNSLSELLVLLEKKT